METLKMMPTSQKSVGTKQAELKSARTRRYHSDWDRFLAGVTRGKTSAEYGLNQVIFKQGEPANSVFYLQSGEVKISAIGEQGTEAISSVLNGGEFLGVGCLAGQQFRMTTATAMMDSTLYRIEKPLMMRMLHENLDVSEFFVKHLLSRFIRYEEDLFDQLCNSSEKRLARTLLLLAHFSKESKAEPVLPRINQATLAEMVGTTRSRISHFMNKFREHGFVSYNGDGELTVRSGLLSVVLGSPASKKAGKRAA